MIPAGEQAADVLRNEILSGRIADGEELTQKQIAQQLGLSRMPIREAFSQLEYEGLLKKLNNRRTKVVGLTSEDIFHYMRILEAIEFETICIILELNKSLAPLEDILDKCKAVSSDSFSTFCNHEIQFHKEIFDLTNDYYLISLFTLRFRFLLNYIICTYSFEPGKTLKLMRTIYNAIHTGDEMKIRQAVHQYFRRFKGAPI